MREGFFGIFVPHGEVVHTNGVLLDLTLAGLQSATLGEGSVGIPPPSRAGPTDGLRSPLPPSACTGLTPTQPCSSFPPPLTQLTPSRCHHHGQHGQESARGAAGPPAAPRHPPAAPHNGRRGREGALTAPPSPRLHPRARTALPALFHPLRAEGGKGEVSPPGSLAPSPLPRPHPVLLILFF